MEIKSICMAAIAMNSFGVYVWRKGREKAKGMEDFKQVAEDWTGGVVGWKDC